MIQKLKKITIKQIFPLLVFAMGFTFFLSLQILLDKMQSPSIEAKEIEDSRKFYEGIYSTLKLKMSSGEVVETNKIGKQIVILNFWATWCAPCLKEIPSLVSLQKRLGESKVKVIGINSDSKDNSRNVAKIIKEKNIQYLNYLDQSEELTDRFKATTLPFTLIFLNGKVIKEIKKEFDFENESFIEELEAALKKT